MSEPTTAEFKIIFEEFSDVADARLDYYLAQAKLQVSEIEFDTVYTHAVYLRLAHSLTLMNPDTAGLGSLSSEKAGDVQYSYAAISGDELLGQTKYGQEFIELRKEHIVAVLVL